MAHRISQQVDQDLAHALRIGATRQMLRLNDLNLDTRIARRGLYRRNRILYDLERIGLDNLRLDPFGIEATQVEQIVEQFERILGRLHSFHCRAWGVVTRLPQQQFGPSVHASQRIAKFVIHHSVEAVPRNLQRSQLRYEAGILNRDCGFRGQSLGNLLVFRIELVGLELVCKVQIPNGPLRTQNRNAKKRLHGRVMLRKAHGFRMFCNIGHPMWARIIDD